MKKYSVQINLYQLKNLLLFLQQLSECDGDGLYLTSVNSFGNDGKPMIKIRNTLYG